MDLIELKKKQKDLNKKLKNPNGKILIIYYISLIILVGLGVFIFGSGNELYFLQYLFWGISILSLAYLIYLFIYFYPKIKEKFMKIMSKTRLTKIFSTNYKFRTFFYSFFSILINAGYVLFEIFLYVESKIFWFVNLAIYHLAIGVYKSLILYREYNDKIRNKYDIDEIQERQIKAYKISGSFITILDILFLASSANLLIIKDKLVNYPYLVLIFAGYFIYKLSISTYNFFKAKKYDSYTTQAIRNLNLVTALFSLFAFQATLFSVIPLKVNANTFNIISILFIFIIILMVSIKMIIKANDKLRKLR